jgi:predicted dehydrogenase
MKILQIGSGSMGTRRIRALQHRNDITLALHDERADRRAAAAVRFDITVFDRLDDALAWSPAALIVSTPPGTKGRYVELAFEHGLHHFLEADMWSYGATEHAHRNPALVSAPSATFVLLPMVKQLAALVRDDLGALLGYQFLLSTYMPSWHPHEGPEYYARHRNTGPAREMIPFELGWLTAIFGPATQVAGWCENFGRLPGETEDTYTLSLRLQRGGVGQLLSTMGCPADYRRGCCFGSAGMATWDISSGEIALQVGRDGTPLRFNFGAIGTVIESLYSEEINLYVDATPGRTSWPASFAIGQRHCSAILAAAEKSCSTRRWLSIDPQLEPDAAPPPRDGTSTL